MNKDIIAKNLIGVFKDFTIEEIEEYTLDGDKIEKILTDKFGKEEYRKMVGYSANEWNDGWDLFEKHYNITK